MKELFKRLSKHPFLTTEIVIATFFITVLNLASPIFAVEILNRFVGSGSMGTLVTLSTGMLLAIALQFVFRIMRTRLASEISVAPDLNLSRNILHVLTKAKSLPLTLLPKSILHEALNGLQVIQNTYNANGINAVLDAPFSMLFVAACYLISPMLAFITFVGVVLSLMAGSVTLIFANRTSRIVQKQNIAQRTLVMSISHSIDTVRVFLGFDFIEKIWGKLAANSTRVYHKDSGVKELSQTVLLTINVLMSTALYAVGAIEVVDGTMTVGGLIGANILAGRAFSSTTKFVQIILMQKKAAQVFKDLENIFRIPRESSTGTVPKEYNGTLELKDVGFGYPRTTNPLYESLDLKIAAGQVVAITGYNGSGKTTLARLIVGLLEPTRGNVMVDNVNLRQLSLSWWRKQLVYLPQEPTFINATISETISMANRDLDSESMRKIIQIVDLQGFIDFSQAGIQTMIIDNGRDLPVGIRKRIALARALANNGRIALLDEPTEGLDDRGIEAVYNILNEMVKARKTIIVISKDPKILKGASIILDLSEKPIPLVVRNQQVMR